jgi:hypothetical protein
MAGRHAKPRGRHAKEETAPTLLKRVWLWVIALTLIATLAPALLGFGLALGVVFGWMTRAITRN